MRSIFNFIIEPKGKQRYNNTENVDGVEVYINTEISNHEFTNRRAIVLETPIREKTNIKKGDEVIVHHNVFRRFHNIRGDETNSRSYFRDNKYFVFSDQIFMYKSPGGEWMPLSGYCFVKPIKEDDELSVNKEKSNYGIVKYANKHMIKNGIKAGTVINFTKNSEYEFVIDGERFYRVLESSICAVHDDFDFEEYNKLWEKNQN